MGVGCAPHLTAAAAVLYFGFIALTRAIEDPRRADRAGAIIALVGAVNELAIIYFSVQWWNTLHQGASVSLTKAPSMAATMLAGMLVMAFVVGPHAGGGVLAGAADDPRA